MGKKLWHICRHNAQIIIHHYMTKLRIGITIGDVNGVGPEILLKAFQDSRLRNMCIPILYGSARVLNIYKKMLQFDKFGYTLVANPSQAKPGVLNVIDCIPDIERIDVGNPSPAAGHCALVALQCAIDDALHQQIDAIVTLPIDKATVKLHKNDFTGHTEMLAEAFGGKDNLMFMVSDDIKVGLVTNHVALSDVSKNLSVARIVAKAKMMIDTLKKDFDKEKPIIAVLGLNPHSGDEGNIGREEIDIITPALAQLHKEGYMAYGPYSPDGFFSSLGFKHFDAVLAMYHDQGLIPFKLLVGTQGVNYTAGMEIIRTSPDHGVAYDIAGKGIADESSFRNALYLAIDVYERRSENVALKANALIIEKKQASQEEAQSAKVAFDEI